MLTLLFSNRRLSASVYEGFQFYSSKKHLLLFLAMSFSMLSCASSSNIPVRQCSHQLSQQDTTKWTDKDLSSIVVLQEAQLYFLDKAEKLYGDSYSVQHLSSPFCFALFNKHSLICEQIIIFDPISERISTEVDVQVLNPYSELLQGENEPPSTMQQIIGLNYLTTNGKKRDISSALLPSLLDKNVPPDYSVYSIQINTYVKQDLNLSAVTKEPIILKFGFDIFPPEEILEHISYPGISTIVVIDPETGSVISVNEDLPFVTTDILVDDSGEYLAIEHLPTIYDTLMYTEYEYWKHGISIVKKNSSEICYQNFVNDEYFLGKDRDTGQIYFHYYSLGYGQGKIVESILRDNKIFSITYDQPSFKRSRDGVLVGTDMLSFEENFLVHTLNCNRLDSIPLRFIPYQERIQQVPVYREIAGLKLRHQLNGSYSMTDGNFEVKEMYPNVLEFFDGSGLSKINYYGNNQELLNSVTPVDLLPLSPTQKAQSKPGYFDGEAISIVSDKIEFHQLGDGVDTFLYDYQLFSGLNVAYRVISYQLWGLNSQKEVVGFQNIIIVLDELGREVYRESFDKLLADSFISSDLSLLCLNFVENNYTNRESEYGALVVKEIRSRTTLLNRFLSENEGEFQGALGFQEIQEDQILLDFDLKFDTKTDDKFIKTGLLHLKERKFYSRYWEKSEVENADGSRKRFFEPVNHFDWQLESAF